ncbi:hypothetical protein CLU79DRAFT_883149 [Phycomyces nitens]|nr:hypothetical protein CLU79DRAFT_883149 [Phycomyces nitens]
MLLSDFPREIIEQIADRLSFEDKISCSLVCKSWKRVFQDTIYSDISINSPEALQDVMTPSLDNRHKYHEIGHLVRYLTISHDWDIAVEKIYALQKAFPNIKYLSFPIAPLDFGSMASLDLWGALTELCMDIVTSDLPIKENSLVEIIACLPLLRRLEIHGEMNHESIVSFSVNDFETIHSHLKHLEHMKLSTNLLTLSDTDLERIPNVSPATTMKTLGITSEKTDYRWLCYLARKYPNLRTLGLRVSYMLSDMEEQEHNTMALFQQVPVSFQHLKKLQLEYSHCMDEEELLFMDKINFHEMPLKHLWIYISIPYDTYFPDNLCNAHKNIAETFLEKCSKTIESLDLNCNIKHATPINLTGMENSLCNLVKVNIDIPTVADIDTFLRAAPRLKYLELAYADIKVKDEFYNSERFELQSFDLSNSTITSNVLRFLSFHCRSLDTLTLSEISVYGNITTPCFQLIDMTYSRFETLSIYETSFIIKDNQGLIEISSQYFITRPIYDTPPKQEYDPNILPVDVEETSDKYHCHWIKPSPENYAMERALKENASTIMKFVSKYEENKKLTVEKALDTKRREPSEALNNFSAFRYTNLQLGFVADYSSTISPRDLPPNLFDF